jgi:hypothetical protein
MRSAPFWWTRTCLHTERKKKEEGGAKFKCNYSGHGNPAIFNDKNSEFLKQNGWGGVGETG